MQRILVELGRRRHLDDPTEVHHCDAIGDVPHDSEVVRNEQVREVELLLQPLEEIDDLRLDRDVECRHRLVRDDEVGIERDCAGQADALALAARELVRVTPGRIGREADDLQEVANLCVGLALGRETVGPQWLADDASNAVAGIEGRIRILEHHLHATAQRPQLVLAQLRDVATLEQDAPGGRLVEPQDRATDGRLATPGLPDEPDRLTALDLQRDVVDGTDVADMAIEDDPALDREVDLEVLELDERPAIATHRPSTGR